METLLRVMETVYLISEKKTNGGKKMYTGREGHFKKNWENCFFSDVNVLELCCECYNLLLYITP